MEPILCSELLGLPLDPDAPPWTPKPGDLAVNFGLQCRILAIGRTDAFGNVHPNDVLVKGIGPDLDAGTWIADLNLLDPVI